MEGRPAYLYGVVGVGPVLQETLGHLHVTVVARKVEGCPALVVLDADKVERLEAPKEGVDQLQGPAASRLLEGGGPRGFVHALGVGAVLEEDLHNIHVADVAGDVEGGVALAIQDPRVGAVPEEELADLLVAPLHG